MMASPRTLIEQAELHIRQCRGLLDGGQRIDQFGIARNLDARDREILDRAKGVDAVIGDRRHIPVAQQVVFVARCDGQGPILYFFAADDETHDRSKLSSAIL